MRLPTILLATCLLLAACVGGDLAPPAEPPGPGQACTEIGCQSLLTVELSDVDIVGEATYGVDLCVDGVCITETVTIDMSDPAGEPVLGQVDGLTLRADQDLVEYSLPGDEYAETAEVSFTLTDADGSVLAETEGEEVPIERFQPNGPGCPPVCLSGRITV